MRGDFIFTVGLVMCGSCCVCNCVSLLSPAMQSAIGNIHGGLCPTEKPLQGRPGGKTLRLDTGLWERFVALDARRDVEKMHRDPQGDVQGTHRGCTEGCAEGCAENAQRMHRVCAENAQRDAQRLHR